MPGAGELRSKVAFAVRKDVDDGKGNPQATAFVPAFECAAQVMPRFGGETVMAARLAGRQPVTIRVRQFSRTRGVTTDWRVTDVRSAVAYNIRSIVDPFEGGAGRGVWLDMLCESGVAL